MKARGLGLELGLALAVILAWPAASPPAAVRAASLPVETWDGLGVLQHQVGLRGHQQHQGCDDGLRGCGVSRSRAFTHEEEREQLRGGGGEETSRAKSGPGAGNVGWFNQTLDHFSTTDRRTFPQRYFEVLDYFVKPASAPIFLLICGEAPCGGVYHDFLLQVAAEVGAAAVALEHRFYGDTQPFADLATPHLAYLSSKQAIADLANFRHFYQRKVERQAGVPEGTGSNKWVVMGISYAGALSAWTRLKFPHLFHASLASSAVVEAILDFYQFDQQVRESAGPECAAALQEVTHAVESLLESDPVAVKAMFDAQQIKDDRDFLFLVADAAVFGFQYGLPDAVCDPLTQARNTGSDVLAAFVNYTRTVFYGRFGSRPSDYDQEALKNPSFGPRSGMRAWMYQTCTEVAYFQNAPPHDSIRSTRLNLQYWRDFCGNVFGEGVFPDTEFTNTYYGGKRIAGSRIIFSNGSQDPWKRASKLNSTSREPSVMVTCHNCGHGVDARGCPRWPPTGQQQRNKDARVEADLGGSWRRGVTAPRGWLWDTDSCSDPSAVRAARGTIARQLKAWLAEDDE